MSYASCPPVAEAFTTDLGGHLVPSALNAWTAGVTGWSAYSAKALGRGFSPWSVTRDLVEWIHAMTDRREPVWASPHEVVFERPIARLRDFTGRSRADVVLTLVLPPQAGHSSCIVDYSRLQSPVKTIREAGLQRCLSLDWVGATQATKDTTVEAVIHAYVEALRRGPGMDFYEQVVALGDGVLRGEYMLNGFIVIRPESEVAKQLELLRNLDDPEHLERYPAFDDWFKHTQDIPGRFYLWIVERLFRDNRLVAGTLEVGGERVDLGRITCPLFLLAGEDDHITPPEQVFALADHAGTAERDVVRRVTSGGHLGLFMGSESLREHWPPIMAAVAEQSRPGAHGVPDRRGPQPTGRTAMAVP